MATITELIENAAAAIDGETGDMRELYVTLNKRDHMIVGVFAETVDGTEEHREVTANAPTLQDAVDSFALKVAHPRQYDAARDDGRDEDGGES